MEKLTYRLEVYEGPLDLLLDLIAKNKIDIMNIPISLICDQYMQYITDARAMDMELAGEFIVMASELLYIKSKMLLPRAEPDEAVHVPGGIAEEQTDLVRKRGVLLQAAAELRHAAVGVADRVCPRGENRLRKLARKILFQLFRAVHVAQHSAAHPLDRQNARPARHKRRIQAPNAVAQRFAVLRGAAEQIACFQPRHCRRTLGNNEFLRHPSHTP